MAYAITLGGTTYTADYLADIKVSRSIDGKGFEGVSTTSLSCKIYTGYRVECENWAITFDSYDLPTFYVSSCDYDEETGVISVTAYDFCKNLDIPFNYSDYTPQFDDGGKANWWATSLIVGALANQCGFAGSAFSGRVTTLCYNDFAGKTCREILTNLSQADVGFWYANSSNNLVFHSFSPSSTGNSIDEDNRTAVELFGRKIISGIYVEDSTYGTEYTTGAAWYQTERFSGRHLKEDIAQEMASQILSDGSYTYIGWSCEAALVSYLYNVGDVVLTDLGYCPVLSADFDFTALGIVASLSAPAGDSSFSEYKDLYTRQIEGKLTLDRSHGLFYAGSGSAGLRLDM